MLLLIFITLIFLLIFQQFYWKRRKYPPGPIPLPLVGNMLQIFLYPPGYETFRKWRKDYGPVFTYWMSEMPVVAICEYEAMKESVIKDGDNYVDRSFMEEFNVILRGGNYGMTAASGDLWRDQRRFTLHTMRDFGMGRNLMEERIMVEVDFLIVKLGKLKRNVYVQQEFDIAIGSVINSVLFGYRFDEEHQHEFELVKGALREMLKAGSNARFLVCVIVPFMRKIPILNSEYYRILKRNEQMVEFIQRQIEERRKVVDLESETSSDFVEAYLKEREARKGGATEEFYCDLQLRNLIYDMWGAGMETTSNTLTWAICYFLNFPEVQEKVHKELDRVIGPHRNITMADKSSLPYLNAVICEIQRFGNILVQNLIRQTTKDATICGQRIPARTVVLPQVSSVLYDEKIFPEPYKFNPDRFLNSDGSLRKIEEFIPFGIGKRQCIGEGLARMELYLFIANILQRFTLSTDKIPSMEKVPGQIVVAKKYFCDFVERT
ncbi:unnamed protein product, partial [Mesorhabditis belari]|uniref:CYtochrome P450 family n=1 Tax=Mesorhabditis belari TaxID=2138241 RepID=A0AAF3FJ95_9BILA